MLKSKMLTRATAAALMTAMTLGAPGCAPDTDDTDSFESNSSAAEGKGFGEVASTIIGNVSGALGIVSFVAGIPDLFGLSGPTYVELSDASIERIALAVGRDVRKEFMSRDNAEARALLTTIGEYTRSKCSPIDNCTPADLTSAKGRAQGIVDNTQKYMNLFMRDELGADRLQAAELVQNLGANRVQFSREIFNIQVLLGTSTDTLPTLWQNTCTASEDFDETLNTLESVYDDFIASEFTAAQVASSGTGVKGKWNGTVRAWFDGPNGRWEVTRTLHAANLTTRQSTANELLTQANNARNGQINARRIARRSELLGASFDKVRSGNQKVIDQCVAKTACWTREYEGEEIREAASPKPPGQLNSNGTAWILTSGGLKFNHKFVYPTASFISVRAGGTGANNVNPQMKLLVNGQTFHTQSVTPGALKDYPYINTWDTGNSSFEIRFANPTANKTRRLSVDKIVIGQCIPQDQL